MMKKLVFLLCLFMVDLAVAAPESATRLDGLISLEAKLLRDTVYPDTEATYELTVESRAGIHFTRVNPPKAEGVDVRRGNPVHEYYFVGNEEFRVSTYPFYLSAREAGQFVLEGASLTHVEATKDGSRRRVRNKANHTTLLSRPVPERYQGLWLPSYKLVLDQTWSSDASTLQLGESITRTVTVFIQGRNIDTFPELTIEYPDGMKTYGEQPKFEARDGGMSMTLRQVLVPRREGDIQIPSLAIPWFDMGSNGIKLATIEGKTFKVLPNKAEGQALANVPNQAEDTVWRNATLVVTILWLITVLGFVRARSQLKKMNKPAPKGMNKHNGLLLALRKNDRQAIVQAWAVTKPHMREEGRQLMDAYFAALYSATPSKGEDEREALIAYLKRGSRKRKKEDAGLAAIAP